MFFLLSLNHHLFFLPPFFFFPLLALGAGLGTAVIHNCLYSGLMFRTVLLDFVIFLDAVNDLS